MPWGHHVLVLYPVHGLAAILALVPCKGARWYHGVCSTPACNSPAPSPAPHLAGLRNKLSRLWKANQEGAASDAPYPWHSVESQMRQVGDLGFLLGQYAFAAATYRLAAGDYLNSGNNKWYAGVEVGGVRGGWVVVVQRRGWWSLCQPFSPVCCAWR